MDCLSCASLLNTAKSAVSSVHSVFRIFRYHWDKFREVLVFLPGSGPFYEFDSELKSDISIFGHEDRIYSFLLDTLEI